MRVAARRSCTPHRRETVRINRAGSESKLIIAYNYISEYIFHSAPLPIHDVVNAT